MLLEQQMHQTRGWLVAGVHLLDQLSLELTVRDLAHVPFQKQQVQNRSAVAAVRKSDCLLQEIVAAVQEQKSLVGGSVLDYRQELDHCLIRQDG